FFFSSRRRHTRFSRDWSSDVCSSDLAKAPEAAQAMGVTSKVLEDLGIVDETIPEPLGGAHRNMDAMADKLRERLSLQVDQLMKEPLDALLERRYQRLMSYGNP